MAALLVLVGAAAVIHFTVPGLVKGGIYAYNRAQWPPCPARDSPASLFYYDVKARNQYSPNGFELVCPRDMEDQVYAVARYDGMGAQSRSPGYMFLAPVPVPDRQYDAY